MEFDDWRIIYDKVGESKKKKRDNKTALAELGMKVKKLAAEFPVYTDIAS